MSLVGLATWIRIRIRIELKSWIRIRIRVETNADPQQCLCFYIYSKLCIEKAGATRPDVYDLQELLYLRKCYPLQ
jgi:hypothetical protein